jgi:hypothetical protein
MQEVKPRFLQSSLIIRSEELAQVRWYYACTTFTYERLINFYPQKV